MGTSCGISSPSSFLFAVPSSRFLPLLGFFFVCFLAAAFWSSEVKNGLGEFLHVNDARLLRLSGSHLALESVQDGEVVQVRAVDGQSDGRQTLYVHRFDHGSFL